MSQPKTSPGQWPGHTGEAGKVVAFDPEGPGQSQDLLVMPADQNVRVREPGVVPEVPGEGLELLDFEVRVDGQTHSGACCRVRGVVGCVVGAWCQTLFLVSKTARKNQEQSLTPSLYIQVSLREAVLRSDPVRNSRQ